MKRLNKILNLNFLLVIIFLFFFLKQFNSFLDINVIEHSVSAIPFVSLFVFLFTLIPVLLFLIYYLPIICVIKFSIKIKIGLNIKVQFNNEKYSFKRIYYYINLQKNYCVFRC